MKNFEIEFWHCKKIADDSNKHKLNIHITILKNINNNNYVIKHSKRNHKNKMLDVFNSINNKQHYIYNNIDVNINVIVCKYDYTELKYLSRFCNNKNIKLIIVSLIHPLEFKKIPHFNMNNYISPYNYKYSLFGNYYKSDTYSNTPINISIKQMCSDIGNTNNIYYMDME
jgi:hypothetical protein